MECLICGKIFNEPRSLKDLFRTKKFNICLECLKKYKLEINFSVIPIKDHFLEIISLFEKDYGINYEAFLETFSIIYKKVCYLNQEKFIVIVSKVYLTDELLIEFEHISTLINKDIIILTNVLLD